MLTQNQLETFDNLKGAKFIGIEYTSKEANETSRYVVNIGVSYEETVRKSLAKIKRRQRLAKALKVKDETILKSLNELEESFTKTLNGTQDKYTKENIYEAIAKGISKHKEDESLEIRGMVISKKVIVKGEYKERKSALKTIMKNRIRKTLPVSKYRSFSVDTGNIHKLKISKESFEF